MATEQKSYSMAKLTDRILLCDDSLGLSLSMRTPIGDVELSHDAVARFIETARYGTVTVIRDKTGVTIVDITVHDLE